MKRKVLLAEDDPDDRHFFSDFLLNRKDVILMPIAEDGIGLIELLESMTSNDELPHVIVLDQNMPKKNGLQTLQFLKEHDRYAHIPVVIYSTYTDETLIKNGSKLGACLVLPKPLTKQGYDQMLNIMLETCL